MAELARRFSIDPLEYRLRHLRDARLSAVLRAAAERAQWSSRRPRAGCGFGIACGIEKGGRVATVVEVSVSRSAAVEIVRVVTACDCGPVVHPDNLPTP